MKRNCRNAWTCRREGGKDVWRRQCPTCTVYSSHIGSWRIARVNDVQLQRLKRKLAHAGFTAPKYGSTGRRVGTKTVWTRGKGLEALLNMVCSQQQHIHIHTHWRTSMEYIFLRGMGFWIRRCKWIPLSLYPYALIQTEEVARTSMVSQVR